MLHSFLFFTLTKCDIRATGMRRVGHEHVAFLEVLAVEIHLILHCTSKMIFLQLESRTIESRATHKLIDPKWIGMNGAFATRSPSGAKRAHEKSRRSLMLVLMDVCCRLLPIASATDMKRLAKRVKMMGSGPSAGVGELDMAGFKS